MTLEGWNCTTIREVVRKDRPVTYGIVQPGEYDPDGTLLIRGQDYIGGWADTAKFFRVSNDLHQQYERSWTFPGDLLLCIVGATTGAVNQVPEGFEQANITQTTARLSCDASVAFPSFVLYYLESHSGQSEVRKYVKGSAQPGLNLADVKKFAITLPPLPEQKRIAAILGNVDGAVQATQAVIDQTRRVKQGLLAQLLTRGIGHTQFKNTQIGEIPEKWEVGGIEAFSRRIQPGLLYDSKSRLPQGAIPILDQSKAGYFGYHNDAPGVVASPRSPVITFANHTCVTRLMTTPFSAIQNVFPLHARSDTDPMFLFQVLSGSVPQRGYRGHWPEVKRLILPKPPLSEQKTIAAILGSVDNEVETKQAVLDQLQILKHGLMQDLLTGRVRVKDAP